ncbi:MAG: putative toxin-antitoxin system toxin component, PIN family [Planctomycetes bacterium]|jgi:putative PIN family toxin of toxin-antitoxin system|nr:putative toxin-antitoxin system toxin component, PIN family [Planctomycetota bacterium]
MIEPVVIDTNVLVAGFLTKDDDGPTARIVGGMLRRTFHYLLSAELLSEYRDVLLRPSVRRRHRLAPAEVDQVLLRIARHGIVKEPARSPLIPPHAGDGHLFALAATTSGTKVVTGDHALLEDPGTRPWTMTPSEFAARLP